MRELFDFIRAYKDELPIVGACITALVSAVWAIIKFRHEVRSKQLAKTIEIDPHEVDIAPNADVSGQPVGKRYVAAAHLFTIAFRAIGGMVIGFLFAPVYFVMGGCLFPLALGIVLGFVSLLLDGDPGGPASAGFWIGVVAWFSASSAWFAITSSSADGSQANDARDGAVGFTSGALVGSIILVSLSKGQAPSPIFATATVGAIIGAVAGVTVATFHQK